MAQLGLKEYVAKLDHLLTVESAEEVIQHSRHILKYFPKNAAVFRALGRALVQTGRWQEAEGALRRVLTVFPDDYAAHLGLSETYTSLNRGDEAISHLERAFEQNPNSRELIDGLRGLYRRFRRADRVKIQLTAAAIARQHRRNNELGQAIDVLRGALSRTPDRIDLRLLLAETLWDTGARVDAAEIAVEVLKVLPDCLSANTIMTRLWLDAQRPSDAMRYLNRLEAVDPYLAYELVQGEAPPPDAFRVDEIDYQQYAERELVSRRPDWLQTIGVSAPTSTTEPEDAESKPEWLRTALSSLPDDKPARRADQPDDSDWMADVRPSRAQSLTGALNLPEEFSSKSDDFRTGELESLFGDDESDWMADVRPGLTGALNLPEEFSSKSDDFRTGELETLFEEDEKPDAWMLGGSFTPETDEAEETPDLDDLFGQLDDAPAAYNVTPASSETEFTFDFASDDQPADTFGFDVDMPLIDGSPAANTDDETLDFRFELPSEAVVTTDDEPEASSVPSWLTTDDEEDEPEIGVMGSANAEHDDIPDWMQSAMEEDNAPIASAEPASTAESMDWLNDNLFEESEPLASDSSDDDPDPLAWITGGESDDRPFESSTVADSKTDSDEIGFNFGSTVPEPDDWNLEMDMNDDQNKPDGAPEGAQDDSLDWLSSFDESSPPTSSPSTDELLSGETDGDDLSWLNDAKSAAKEVGADDDALSWLNTSDDDAMKSDSEEDESAVTVDDMPDWLSEFEPSDEGQTVSAAADEPAGDQPVEEELSWLTEVEDAAEAENPVAVQNDDLGWLVGEDAEDDAEPEAAPVADDMPDWLSSMKPEEPVRSTADEEDDLAWLSEAESNADAATANALQSDELSWLTEDSDDDAVSEDDDAPMTMPTTADLNWTPDDDDDQPALTAADMPDWLTGGNNEPEAEAEPEAVTLPSTDDLSWLSGDEDTSDDIPAAEEIPDWMSDLEPETAALVGEDAAEEDDLSWLSESPAQPPTTAVSTSEASSEFSWLTEPEAAAPSPAETPEWLSELEQMKEDSNEVTLLSFKPDLSPVQTENLPPVASVNESPDWLNEIGDTPEEPAEEETEAEPAASTDDDFAWFGEEEKAQPVASVNDVPDWLQSIQGDDEDEAEKVSVSSTSTDDQMIEAVSVEGDLDLSANDAETFAFIDAMTADDEDEERDLYVEADDELEGEAESFDFLSEMDDDKVPLPSDEDAMPEDADAEFVMDLASEDDDFADQPDAEIDAGEVESVDGITETPEPEPEIEPETEPIAAALEDEGFTLEAAENAPDWLNAMVPGLDVDYEAREDDTESADELEERAVPAAKRDYNWVVALAEAEAAQETPAEVRPRFTFSRPPAWMADRSETKSSDDGLPDWVSDDDDEKTDGDLPSWLQ